MNDKRHGSAPSTDGGTDNNSADDRTDTGRFGTSRRRFLAASAVTGASALGLSGATTGVRADAIQDGEPEPFASVEFPNQFSEGTNVVVNSTVVSDGGWVTFHDISLFEAKPLESVVGISEYLDPGIHYQIEATLFDVPGRTFEQPQLEATTALVAMPHRDTNDNRTYEFVTSKAEQDPQYVEAGLPVVDLGYVTVGEAAEEQSAFASLDFENQVVEDATVTVEDVVLSEGGFVTLHDVRLLRGKPLESVVGVSEYLGPGEHDVVEVELDDPTAITQVEFPPAPPLVAMPHRDTNGNREYDFVESNGEEDGPYVEAKLFVVDLGFVKVGE